MDGFSRDGTEGIARRYADKFLQSRGFIPRARNLGFANAKGDIYFSVDSDMILEPNVLEEISSAMGGNGALIVPETGYGSDFISRCKDLEKRCYVGDRLIESARAFSPAAFRGAGEYDPMLIFGEDWDLHSRLASRYPIGRINARLLHNTQGQSLAYDLKKAYKYGKSLPAYLAKGHAQSRDWFNPRSIFFVRHFFKLVREPALGLGISLIKGMEYFAGLIGYLAAIIHGEGR